MKFCLRLIAGYVDEDTENVTFLFEILREKSGRNKAKA